MKLNQSLSWKLTLPSGAVIWLIGKIIGGIIGSSLCLLGFIMVVFGIVGLIRNYSKRRQGKEIK